MSYDDDPDLWQPDAGSTETRLSSSRKFALTQAVREQVPLKRAILEQRRIDLQSITDLLSRAANDLRASERRAVEAEERAKLAEDQAKLAAARATDAEARERKINAQAVRAFETMKERIAQSEARAAAAEAQAKDLDDRLQDAQRNVQNAAEIEKAAEARCAALEARLQAAEMRIAAARRALAEDVVVDELTAEHAARIASEAVFMPSDAEIVDTHVRH